MSFVGTSVAALIATRAFLGLLFCSCLGIGTCVAYLKYQGRCWNTSWRTYWTTYWTTLVYDFGGHWSVCAVALTVHRSGPRPDAVSCGEHNHRDKDLNQDPSLAENQPRHIYDAVKNQNAAGETRTRHEIANHDGVLQYAGESILYSPWETQTS